MYRNDKVTGSNMLSITTVSILLKVLFLGAKTARDFSSGSKPTKQADLTTFTKEAY